MKIPNKEMIKDIISAGTLYLILRLVSIIGFLDFLSKEGIMIISTIYLCTITILEQIQRSGDKAQ